jgi:isoleucyl-tRNA synthetase
MRSIDYKSTLNLPRTDFGMKANLTSLEPRILEFWKKIDIYKKIRASRAGREKFVLHDGPPYANGLIHIGHALNKILKDIIVKFKAMQGQDIPFVCGWDCHGLPVEHQLFKELGLTKHDVEIGDFRKRATRFALKFVELQKRDFQRLGVFSDWENSYLTLDYNYEYWVMKLLEFLVNEGYVYRGLKPVNWCPICETALAEAEVEYADKESHSIYLLFEVVDDKGLFSLSQNCFFLVWTTTPWTLISNVAVAVNPEFDYALVGDGIYNFVLAKSLTPLVEEKLRRKLSILKVFKGKDFEFIRLRHPFLDRESILVLADFVSGDEGSGCVHIAPGHGQEDFSLVKKYNLEVIMPVNEKGVFTQSAPDFEGKNVEQASEQVLDRLKQKNILLNHEKLIHSYPHCWRCKNPIVFRATYQWFLNVDHNSLRAKTLEQIKKVNWVPGAGLERIRAMLASRPDWCLSRQRLWGVPIPAIKCKGCGEIILDGRIISITAQVFKEKGSDSWFTLGIKDFLPPGFRCSKCGGSDFSKETDILDVWFESGASFLAVLEPNSDLSFPADMYLEGSDQHRGWFQVSLIPAVAKEGIAPFRIILTHGFVVDGEGRKMSKSLGNVISPQEIITQYGSEILRIWTAYSDYTEDVKISAKILGQLVDIYRKVRNTIRFILGNLYDFSPKQNKVPPDQMLEVDRFMLSKTSFIYEEVLEYYSEFSFYKVLQEVFNFCNIDLSSFYLDILKDRLYTYSPNSWERRSAQSALYYILRVLIKMIAPILSFTAEEAFGAFGCMEDKKESIYLHEFREDIVEEYKDPQLMERWKKILSLREEVLKGIERKREVGLVASSLEAKVTLSFEQSDFDFYKDYIDTLREVFIVSEVEIKKGKSSIEVTRHLGSKCSRCWNWRNDIGLDSTYPDLCKRCVEVVKNW